MPISSVKFLHWGFANIYPSGELTLIGFAMVEVAILFLLTKVLDMNECDAPESNKTNAVKEFSRNIPIIAPGYSYTSSTLT